MHRNVRDVCISFADSVGRCMFGQVSGEKKRGKERKRVRESEHECRNKCRAK